MRIIPWCRSFVLAFFYIAAFIASGCSGTDAYITRIVQSEAGDLVAFSTGSDDAVRGVTSDDYFECGVKPFAMSPSGRLIVARAPDAKTRLNVIHMTGGSRHRTDAVSFISCLPDWSEWVIEGIRCDGQMIVLRIRKVVKEWPAKDEYEWITIPLDSLQCERASREAWEAMPASAPLTSDVREADGTKYEEYRSHSGITILKKLPSMAVSSLWRINPDGTETLLLMEDLFSFWGRWMATRCIHYP